MPRAHRGAVARPPPPRAFSLLPAFPLTTLPLPHKQAAAFPPAAAIRLNLRMVAILAACASPFASSAAAADAARLLDVAAPALANEAVSMGGARVGPVAAWCAAAAAVRRGLIGTCLAQAVKGLAKGAADAEVEAAIAASCPPLPPPLLVGTDRGSCSAAAAAADVAAAAAAVPAEAAALGIAVVLPNTQVGGGGDGLGGPGDNNPTSLPVALLAPYEAGGPDTPARRLAAVRALLNSGSSSLPDHRGRGGLAAAAARLLPLADAALGHPALDILTTLRDQTLQQAARSTAEAGVGPSPRGAAQQRQRAQLEQRDPARRRFGACGVLVGPVNGGQAATAASPPGASERAAEAAPAAAEATPSPPAGGPPLVAVRGPGTTVHWSPTPTPGPALAAAQPAGRAHRHLPAVLLLPGVDAATAAVINRNLAGRDPGDAATAAAGAGFAAHPLVPRLPALNRDGRPRRKNPRWSGEEEDALRTLVDIHGVGRWSTMQAAATTRARAEVLGGAVWASLAARSTIDLKDKWRGLCRRDAAAGGGVGVCSGYRRRRHDRDRDGGGGGGGGDGGGGSVSSLDGMEGEDA